jgi:hypothetical protein
MNKSYKNHVRGRGGWDDSYIVKNLSAGMIISFHNNFLYDIGLKVPQ